MDIKTYQKKCFSEYKEDISLLSNYNYLYGNPINALVPVETEVNKFMVVGAYPSAKFFTINGISDVPLYDNDSPFSNETYYDGSKTRNVPSGNELNEMLFKIDVKRENCWITDLVKVFLFKDGHIKKYNKLGIMDIIENRTKFYDYAKKSLKWLNQEISIADPKVIITLGTEVTSIIFDVSEQKAKTYLDGNNRRKILSEKEFNIISLPHPGILMRNEQWRNNFDNKISYCAKKEIAKILK